MKKQFYLKSLLCLLMIFVGMNAWAAEGDTHDFTQTLSQLLNNNASIASISIPEQDYKIAKVVVSYRTTKSASKVNIACTVGSESWGNKDITSGATTTMEFTGDALKGAVNLTFTNNSGTGTGKGTFYVTNVRLVEGAEGASLTAPTLDVAAGTYNETQTVKVSNYSEDYIYAYTTDGTNPAFDESLNITNGTAYNHSTGISISQSCTLKILAIDENGVKSSVVSAAYVLPVVFANLEALVAADLTSGTLVKVSFEDAQIASVYKSSQDKRTGIYLNVQKGGNNIEIFYSSEEVPEAWVTGGTVSGTMTCPWVYYSAGEVWELAPAKDTFAWSNLTYTAPAVTKQTPTITATYKPALTVGGSADVFTVTYDGDGTLAVSSSATAVATAAINGNEVTVTPVAKGTTTITISAPETENYYSALKSYTLTVNEPTPAAELPFSFDGGVSDIAKTTGMTQNGLGTDYTSSPKLKFDGAGDYVIINYKESAKTVSYTIKGNSFSKSTFEVMESADGETYTTIRSFTELGDPTTYTDKLNADSRYVKFYYKTKSGGNVALGAINITNEKADAGLAFAQSTYRFLTTAESKSVTATPAKESTGAITYALTEGDAEAFAINTTTGAITCATAGTYTVTATIAEDDDYKSGTAKCTVVVKEPVVANSIIVATTTDGDAYAMTTAYNSNGYFEHKQIYPAGEKYLVTSDIDKILFRTETTEGKTTIQNTEGQYVQATAVKKVSYTDNKYDWTDDGEKLTAATASYGTLQYNTSSPRFTTYSSKTGQYATIVASTSVTTDGYVKTVGDGEFYTICLPKAVAASEFAGAEVYSIAGVITNGEAITNIALVEETGRLVAGKPYIICGTANNFVVAYTGEAVAEPVAATGLVGNLSSTPLNVPQGSYIISADNKLHKLCEGATATVAQNRAYINLEGVAEYSGAAVAKMMNVYEDTTTAISNINADANLNGKFIENGKVVIVRNGEKYNVNGQVIK